MLERLKLHAWNCLDVLNGLVNVSQRGELLGGETGKLNVVAGCVQFLQHFGQLALVNL